MGGAPMRPGALVELATTFGLLSLIAIGGANAIVPDIQRQVVDVQHWMTSGEFANLFAIAQAAPGPNVLVVSLVGWRVAGLSGLLVATAAICGPSCLLAFGTSRLLTRFADAEWIRFVKTGLAPIAIALFLASGLVMARSADAGAVSVAATAASALFVFRTPFNPLWPLAGGGLLGLLGLLGQ